MLKSPHTSNLVWMLLMIMDSPEHIISQFLFKTSVLLELCISLQIFCIPTLTIFELMFCPWTAVQQWKCPQRLLVLMLWRNTTGHLWPSRKDIPYRTLFSSLIQGFKIRHSRVCLRFSQHFYNTCSVHSGWSMCQATMSLLLISTVHHIAFSQ